MYRRAADRAGLSRSQCLCKDPRLLAQERAIHVIIALLCRVILLLGGEIIPLGNPQLRFQSIRRIKRLQGVCDLFSLRFDTVLFPQQRFPLCSRGLQCLPFGLQLLCLPGIGIQRLIVLLQGLLFRFQLKLGISPFEKSLLSGVIFRKQCLQGGRLCGESVGLGLSGHGLVKSGVQGFLFFRCLLQLCPGLLQRLLRFLQFFRPTEIRVQYAEFRVQAAEPVAALFETLRVFPDKPVKQLHHLFRRELSRMGFSDVLGMQIAVGASHAADILPDAPPFVFAFTGKLPDVVLQSFLKDLIVAGMEDLAENRLAVFRLCQQQAQEVSLGDHGDLGKLVPVDAENILDGRGHFPLLCHASAVGADELGFRCLFRCAGSAAFCLLVLRLSRHGILLPRVGEGQCHEGRPVRVGVLGPQHGGLAVVPAGLSVQGEGDRVENGRLPRAGIAGDQVQSALPQLLKVDGLLPRIGAEGRHDQIQRSHILSSQMSSISAVT